MNDAFPTLHTARLTLRLMQPTDAPTLHQIYQTTGVLRYFPDPIPPPLERVERSIAFQQAQWQEHGCGNWGILPEGAPAIIGWAGLQFVPDLNETEVGFLLDRPYWGKGYATEAALASLEFGYTRLGLDHIIALVHPENLASRRVIEKCEMNYLETITLWGTPLRRYCKERPETQP